MPQRQPTASGSTRDESAIANIALLYYKEGLNQSEIAKRTGLSRATIVNYLRQARDRGIVDIRVRGESMRVSPQARALRGMFGLEDVYVADTGDDADAAINLRQTARVAAAAFRDIVRPGDRVGVAWGQTMKLVADELSAERIADTEVCQIIGAMDTSRILTAETCAIQIASRIGAVCHTLHAPAVLASVELAAALGAEPTIRSQLARLATLDCLFTSVGNLDRSGHLVTSGIVSVEALAEIVARGGTGFICSRFLDAEGRCIDLPLYARMIAAGLDDILRTKRRVVVASGAPKRDALLAALKGGFATHLVVDRPLAASILGGV